jgi:hypothetical protein
MRVCSSCTPLEKDVVPISSREGFYTGLAIALVVGLFLVWLWRPERQIQRHSENLLRAIEKRDWTRFAAFIANDYQDQWGNDSTAVLERTREVFRYVRTIRLTPANPTTGIANHAGFWTTKITVDGDNSEVIAAIKERVNSLATPFRFEWRQTSGKPWDWKLVRVSNAELEIPEYQ